MLCQRLGLGGGRSVQKVKSGTSEHHLALPLFGSQGAIRSSLGLCGPGVESRAPFGHPVKCLPLKAWDLRGGHQSSSHCAMPARAEPGELLTPGAMVCCPPGQRGCPGG